jgi:hypothetical protein
MALSALPISRDLPSAVPVIAGATENLRALDGFLTTFGDFLQEQGVPTTVLTRLVELSAIRQAEFNLYQQWFDQAVVYANIQSQLRAVQAAHDLIVNDILGIDGSISGLVVDFDLLYCL